MNDNFERLLREHDPAAAQTLTSFDRTRILQSARERQRIVRPRIAAAVMMLILILTILALRPQREQNVRQIQYATPGGTRIVWTLDPNFHM